MLEPLRALTLQLDTFNSINSTDRLDGSVKNLSRFLQELVEMTGQHDGTHSVPVLELQFGNILTATSLLTPKDAARLSITALLSQLDAPEKASFQSMRFATQDGNIGDWELLWHGEEGRYVVARKIPISVFIDERSVMNAIADTSDQAAAWFAKILG